MSQTLIEVPNVSVMQSMSERKRPYIELRGTAREATFELLDNDHCKSHRRSLRDREFQPHWVEPHDVEGLLHVSPEWAGRSRPLSLS